MSGPTRINSMELIGTYVSSDGAKAAVRLEVQSRASQFPGTRQICEGINGEFCGAITQHGKIKRFMNISYDSGETDNTCTYVNPS